jgi:hypothetical protein
LGANRACTIWYFPAKFVNNIVSFAETLASIPADRLPSVIDGWLWEFHDPANWPNAVDAAVAIDILKDRPDASDERVQLAITKCLDFLG